jgi:hypothetical protein
MNHQEVQVQVEHLVQMDHQEVPESSGANGSSRKCRIQVEHADLVECRGQVGTSSGANESSRGTEIERVEHLDEVTYRSKWCNGSSGKYESKVEASRSSGK